jgi:protein ImuB
MIRLACVAVPLFPLAARLRSEPELMSEALAIFQGNGNAARLVAATRRARKAGLKPGMSLPQARSLVPKLTVRSRDSICEEAAQASLLEVVESFSPRVEDAREGLAYLDLSGLERHYQSPTKTTTNTSTACPEEHLGRILIAAGDRAGLPIRVGIASTKLAARVAAELPGSPTVIPAGEEAAALAPLPLTRLSPEGEVLETLQRWGIHSIGAFAHLSSNEIASRLGSLGQKLHEQARGLDQHPLVPHHPPPYFEEGMELEWPLVALEPFLFVGRAALERLCRRLEERGFACTRLLFSLHLEPCGHHERAIQLPAPTRDIKTLLTLVRLDLEATPPGAPVIGFTFVAHPDRPRRAQLSLFGPTDFSPDKLATTLARLFALLGPGRVGSPRPVNGHRPERFALVDYAPPPPPKIRQEPATGRGLLAIRVVRPPIPLEVLVDNHPNDLPDSFRNDLPKSPPDGLPSEIRETATSQCTHSQPRQVRTLASEATTKQLRLQGNVKVASGPWNLEEEWWTQDPIERDYWDIELSDGGIYRIYRERTSGDWFADGIYD